MNKIRLVGIILLFFGVIIQFIIENNTTDFISGLLIGAGLGFTITGKFNKQKV